jgi:hypothetical protein
LKKALTRKNINDFFSDNRLQQGRNLARDTFKIDIEDDNLCISVSRRVRLADAQPDNIKAKLDEGVLSASIPKKTKRLTRVKLT